MSENTPGYAVVLAERFGESRSLSIQFNFAQQATASEMNTEIDKLISVYDRQAAKHDLVERRREYKAQSIMAEVIADDIQRMEEQLGKIGQAGNDPVRRNAVNTQQITQNVVAQKEALKKTRRMVEELDKIIADLEKKAA